MTSSSPLPDFEVLSGTWESPALEPMPLPDGGQMFLTRAFDFDDKKRGFAFRCGQIPIAAGGYLTVSAKENANRRAPGPRSLAPAQPYFISRGAC
jgi:hypothetical protein